MFVKEIPLMTKDEIYNMPDGDLKSFELIKKLLSDELDSLKGTEKEDFVKKTIEKLVLLHDMKGTGHNLD